MEAQTKCQNEYIYTHKKRLLPTHTCRPFVRANMGYTMLRPFVALQILARPTQANKHTPPHTICEHPTRTNFAIHRPTPQSLFRTRHTAHILPHIKLTSWATIRTTVRKASSFGRPISYSHLMSTLVRCDVMFCPFDAQSHVNAHSGEIATTHSDNTCRYT